MEKNESEERTEKEEEEEGEYDLRWEHFHECASGNDTGVLQLTGSYKALSLLDQVANPILVERAYRLLDALCPDPDDVHHDDEEKSREEDDGEEQEADIRTRNRDHRSIEEEEAEEAVLALEPLPQMNVTAGSWHEDIEAGRRRACTINGKLEMEDPSIVKELTVKVRVYRASATPSDQAREGQAVERFELTFIECSCRAYIFVIDKVERRYVFVGEDGSHPHCGTNEFIYDNSDGSGPGLLTDDQETTPLILLQAARRRFRQYCSDVFH